MTILAVLSLAIPAAVLALVVSQQDGAGSPSGKGTPTTTIAPFDASKARVGAPAPPFARPSTAGHVVTLSSLRGRAVVLVFFASWCHPCEEELPVLDQLARDERGRLQVVGITFQDLHSDSVDFVRRLHVSFPALFDTADGQVAGRYGVRGIPQTVFVDARGIVRGRVYGQTSRRALEPAVDDLLRGVDIRPV